MACAGVADEDGGAAAGLEDRRPVIEAHGGMYGWVASRRRLLPFAEAELVAEACDPKLGSTQVAARVDFVSGPRVRPVRPRRRCRRHRRGGRRRPSGNAIRRVLLIYNNYVALRYQPLASHAGAEPAAGLAFDRQGRDAEVRQRVGVVSQGARLSLQGRVAAVHGSVALASCGGVQNCRWTRRAVW